jgi:hypothetical protein
MRETNAEKLARWHSTGYGKRGGAASDRLRTLEGLVAIETDEDSARIPVLNGTVSLGDTVSLYRRDKHGAVSGYEVRTDKTYHWIGIVVTLPDGAQEVWEWDNTEVH